MKVYLAYSGDINKHGFQSFELIGVFKDKDDAILAITSTFKDVDEEQVAVDSKDNTIFWTEFGYDVVTVGMLKTEEVIEKSF